MPSDKLETLLKNVSGLNVDHLILEACKEVEKQIVKLNTKNQLFFRGINANDRKLKPYAESTRRHKIAKNLPTWTTLYETGKFHSSFRLEIRGEEIWFTAPENERGRGFSLRDHLVKVYGKDIFGLTEDSMERLKKMILEELYKLIAKNVT